MCEEKIICIADYRISEDIKRSFSELNIEIILTRKNEIVAEPINGHPDIIMMKYDYNTLVISPDEMVYYQNKLKDFKINIIKGKNKLGQYYPDDILYNGFKLDKYYFHNIKYTDKSILELLAFNDIRLVNVKQGYTKCSTINLQEKGLITSDKNIHRAAVELNLDCLLISQGYVELKGYEYGFIGGATGYLDDRLYITGNIDKHPDGGLILEFLKEKKIELICLSNNNIYDYGTLIMIKIGGKNEE
jgi:hypothetical protein